MFNLREFIKKHLLDAVGSMADYQVALNAVGWYEKNVLTTEDLSEIESKINSIRREVLNTDFIIK